MRYQIYEAKSVKYDAQQRVGVIAFDNSFVAGNNLRRFFCMQHFSLWHTGRIFTLEH